MGVVLLLKVSYFIIKEKTFLLTKAFSYNFKYIVYIFWLSNIFKKMSIFKLEIKDKITSILDTFGILIQVDIPNVVFGIYNVRQ